MQSQRDSANLGWVLHLYPETTASLPSPIEPSNAAIQGFPTFSRFDYSPFINSMDDASFAYFSLIHELASRPLQGGAFQYRGLYRALVSQNAEEESSAKVSIIELDTSGSRSKTFAVYDSFKAYVDAALNDRMKRRLIILEDLPVRYVCLLGAHLRVLPTIFARHCSTVDSSTISDNVLTLPSFSQNLTDDGLEYASDNGIEDSTIDNGRTFTLRYPITMPRISAKQHPDPAKCPPWLRPSSQLIDQSAYAKFHVERTLDTPTSYGKWDARGEMSELEGQVTYWSHQYHNGTRNALLLVDPCLKDPSHLALLDGAAPPTPNISRAIRYPELEDHHKLDIASSPLQWHPSAAFTKYNLHDDILIHFSVAEAGPGQNPLTVTPFVRGFALSKWVAHLNHVRRCYTHTRAALFSDSARSSNKFFPQSAEMIRHTARWGADWEEWIFEVMTRFVTDLTLYRLEVETNMRALGIDIDDSHSYGLVGRREAQMWRYLRSTCSDLQEMFQQLQNSYTQVVVLREAQASNLQAKSVRWLSVLGTVSVPLSVVAGVMSMGGDYLPGEKKFWVYCAVSGPLLLIICLALVAITDWGSLTSRSQKARALHDSESNMRGSPK